MRQPARKSEPRVGRIEEKEELPLVMREIASAMSAHSAALTLHPSDGRKPSLVHLDEDAGVGREVIEELLERKRIHRDGSEPRDHSWIECDVGAPGHDVLLIPVERVPGHSGLMISAFFDRLTEAKRREAEEVYLRRRPFAVGYFRLWQLERTRKRRIEALESAINLTEFGVILLDRGSNLVFCNNAAERVLASGDGLRRRQGAIHATHLRDDLRLQVALDHVINANIPGADGEHDRTAPMMSIKRENGPPLILSVLPTDEPAAEPSDVAAVVYLVDPALETDQLLEPICKMYHLTPVETKLTCKLAAGASLVEAATAIHVKEQTARSCLKQIFAKTETNRQAELVRLMLSNLIRTTPTIPSEVM